MPKPLENKLKRQFRKKGMTGNVLDHAVFGTMTNIEKAKGKTMRGTPLKKKKGK